MIDSLLLLSGNDIPFVEAELSIHVPTLKEIGYIGEDSFFIGVQFLTLDKTTVLDTSQQNLDNITNFDIVIQLLNTTSSAEALFNKKCAELILTLLFPDYKIVFLPTMIACVKDQKNYIINNENFNEFQDILKQMFCLDMLTGAKLQEYDPANKRAESIINKIKAGRTKLAKIKSQQNHGQKITILSRYISILTVGEQKDMNTLLEYNIYQLFDEFNRFSLKQQSDFYLQAKMAGAKDLQEVDNWMKDIHSNSE